MATYVNNLRLKEITTGDESGTWGTSTNTNLELVGEALGYGTEAITTNADTHASTVADGSADEARATYIKYSGNLDSDCTITIGPNTLKRVHIIENATGDSGSSGPYNIIIKQGTGATVTIANGKVGIVYLDGAGGGAAVTSTGNIGDESIISNNILPITGQAATGAVGTESVTAAAGVDITGESILGTLGQTGVNIWGLIDTSQSPSYSIINTSQTPNWEEVA